MTRRVAAVAGTGPIRNRERAAAAGASQREIAQGLALTGAPVTAPADAVEILQAATAVGDDTLGIVVIEDTGEACAAARLQGRPTLRIDQHAGAPAAARTATRAASGRATRGAAR